MSTAEGPGLPDESEPTAEELAEARRDLQHDAMPSAGYTVENAANTRLSVLAEDLARGLMNQTMVATTIRRIRALAAARDELTAVEEPEPTAPHALRVCAHHQPPADGTPDPHTVEI